MTHFSMLIDEKPDGRCRAWDIVANRARWFSDYSECREFLRYLDACRREVPNFGMLTEEQKAKKGKRTARKPKADTTPWMDPSAGVQTTLFGGSDGSED